MLLKICHIEHFIYCDISEKYLKIINSHEFIARIISHDITSYKCENCNLVMIFFQTNITRLNQIEFYDYSPLNDLTYIDNCLCSERIMRQALE